ncbi:hypothetical protein [Halosimplex amylolyticum]|uniref:hypothetical protein n=1 Tax=Halosimplex amylolyticum TaxID=3396616 RepID=UPI003F57ECDE
MALNRLLVVVIWALAVRIVASWSRERDLLGQLLTWEYTGAVFVGIPAAVVLHAADNLVMWTIGSEDLALRTFGEHAIFASTYGSPDAAAVFLMQLLYYLCEALVVGFMIALCQQAGEQQFGVPSMPWGGIGIALSWGRYTCCWAPR